MYERNFASVYDRLTKDYDYEGWAASYLSLMGSVKTLCECGCGTGSMTVAFAALVPRVTGVDISPDMLEIAAGKARAAGVFIPFVCQDMCALTLHKPVEAVAVPCDGVNYLAEPTRVRAFFARAFAALAPGGTLAFDVSSQEKLFAMPGAPFYEDLDDLSYFWRNRLSGRLLHMELTFFLRGADGRYDRFDETQTQRAHSIDELTSWLEGAGFTGVHVYGDRTLSAPEPGAQRWHFLARKPF